MLLSRVDNSVLEHMGYKELGVLYNPIRLVKSNLELMGSQGRVPIEYLDYSQVKQ